MNISELDTPVLLVDGDAVDRNMARMATLTAEAGIAWRPHAKAHKSPQVAEMQIELSKVGTPAQDIAKAIHEYQLESGMQKYLYQRVAHGEGIQIRGDGLGLRESVGRAIVAGPRLFGRTSIRHRHPPNLKMEQWDAPSRSDL